MPIMSVVRVLSICLFSGTLAISSLCAADSAATEANESCHNKPDPYCDCCICGKGDKMPDSGTCDGSYISFYSDIHIHDATDYLAPNASAGGSGCGSCGSSAPTVGKLESLEIKRYHNSRKITRYSSFGPGVYSNYDVQLSTFTPSTSKIKVVLPWHTASSAYWKEVDVTLGETLVDGIFREQNNTHHQETITLYDINGLQTADMSLTTTAILEYDDGEKIVFEIFEESLSGRKKGRFSKRIDRNGNELVVNYVWPRNTSNGDLGNDRTKLWQIATVTDPYGHTASFHYKTSKVGNRWVVERIDVPNGSSISYYYNTDRLIGVTHPDGTQSTFTYGYDAAIQASFVTYDDAAASGTHRRKTGYYTTNNYVDPITNEITTQVTGLIRKIVRPDNTVSYQRWGDTENPLISYIYQGGHKLTRMTFSAGYGLILEKAVAEDYVHVNGILPDVANLTWLIDETFDFGSRRHYDGIITHFDAGNSYTVDHSVDLVNNVVTEQSYPDGTTEQWTYNSFSQPIEYIDRLGRTQQWVYDANGNKLSHTRAVGTADEATWHWTYNAKGQPLSSTDALGHSTTFTYNTNNYLISVSEPADILGDPAIVRTYHYDSAGRVIETVDGGGHVVRYEYDTRNRNTAILYGFYTSPNVFYEHSREQTIYGTGVDANLPIEYRDRNDVRTSFAYDDYGRRIQTVQAAGTPEAIEENCTYLAGTSLKISCTKAGETLVYGYDYKNRQVSTTRQANGLTLLTNHRLIDISGRSLSRTDAYGRSTYFLYDMNNRLIRTVTETIPNSIIDTTQAALATLTRDLSPNAAYLITDTITDAVGQRIASIDARSILHTSSYDFQGRLVSQTEAAATVSDIETAYAANTDIYGLISIEDAFAAMTLTPINIAAISSITYDAQGNRLISTNPRGFVTAYSYTQRNLVDSITEALGTVDEATRLITYTATRKQATTTDFRGNVTSYSYYPCCDWLAQITEPTGAVTSYVYDNERHVTSLIDPNGNTTLTTYDALYRVKTRTNAENETTTYSYDDNATDGNGLDVTYAAELTDLDLTVGSDGQIISVTNAEGETSTQIRDGLGRTIRTIDALGNANTTLYDTVVAGLLEVSATDALGHINRSRTDAAGRRITAIDAENKSSSFQYDANSNRISYRDANGVGQNCEFDARNRDISCTDTQGDSTTREYDANNNIIAKTDALGNLETCTFDTRDRNVSCTDRINSLTQYTYDPDNNLLTIVDAEGGQTSYTYDSRSLLVDETFPAGNAGTTRRLYLYDEGRRLISRTVTTLEAPAVVEDTHYFYDQANRLLNRTYPQEANTQDEFAYDGASRLTSASSQRYSNVVSRSYDAASRLSSESLSIDGNTYTVSYGYDDANRQTSITYPDGKVITRSYTDRNQLESVGIQGELTSLMTNVYDAGQREVTRTYGNGLVKATTYRADNLTSNISVGSVLDLSYSYDANKRKIGETDAFNAAASQTFNYDTKDRLTAWAGNSNTQSWNLSAVGDWNAIIRNGIIENRSHTAVHEVTAINGNSLTYDFKGNLASHSNSQLYTWDSENRMKSANGTLADDYIAAVYHYDALGRRVAKATTREITIPAGALHHVDAQQMTTWGKIDNLVSDPERGQVMGYNAGTSDNLSALIQNLNGQPAFTISIWAKADDIPTDKGLFKTNATEDDSSKAIYLRYDKEGYNSGTATEIIKGGVDTTGGRLKYESSDHTQTTEWQHLTMSWESGDRIRLFINGVEDEPSYENGSAEGVLQNITGFILGRSVKDNASGASWEGLLDDLRIYNRALTPAEVACLHNADQYPTQNSGTTVSVVNTTVYVLEGAQVVQEYDNGTLGNSYAYGPYVDEPCALINKHNEKSYYHTGSLYSVEAMTDENGNVVESYSYDSYGKTYIYDPANSLIDKSLVGNTYGFTGRRLDKEVDLYFFRARYYDVDLGRFIGRDNSTTKARKGVSVPEPQMGYHDGLGLYSAYFVPCCVDPSGFAKPENCMIELWFGHYGSKGSSKFIKRRQRYLKKHPELCYYFGVVSCFGSGENAKIKEGTPGHEIPGMPDMPGLGWPPGHENDPEEGDWDFKEKAYEAVRAAMVAGRKMCEECCCTEITLKINCDKMDSYDEGIRPQQVVPELCGKTIKANCNALLFIMNPDRYKKDQPYWDPDPSDDDIIDKWGN